MGKDFVHLHVHSEYSMANGIIRIDELFAKLVESGQTAVALADQGNMFATVKFFKAAIKYKIKPIIGCEVEIYETNIQQTSKLVLLAQNAKGYKNLKVLVSKSYTEGQHHGKPLCCIEWLTELAEGLIALSGASKGDIGQAIIAGDFDQALSCAKAWDEIFPGRFYLELVRTSRANEEEIINHSLEIAEKLNLPVVATNDVHFIQTSDFDAHEARVCINDGRVLNDPRRSKDFSIDQYLCNTQEMLDKFADIPEALANSVQIAKRCTVPLELGKSYLPAYPIPRDLTEAEYLQELSEQGLVSKLLELYPDKTLREQKSPEYESRLSEELAVINKMGFPGYFLIVSDFVRWTKAKKIPVGPGRGSGAGSLVAYVLEITALDPLVYDLLFERFLNKDRISMPDFDIDFCMEGRDRVIAYVADKYGQDKVSQIITYGSMNAKGVVRDVGRVLDYPYGMVDSIAKLIPFDLKMTLNKALTESEDLAKRYAVEEEVKEIIDLAKSLEGIKRNAGKHAGGVVISPTELTDFTPLYCEENVSSLVSQFDKNDVEDVGLVKFDFLGLRTLTIIDWALQAINATADNKVDIDKIALDDPKVYELLCAQSTTAVFQLESGGVKDLIRRLQPTKFAEIIALVALYRPGPLEAGMTDSFVERKHGREKIEYSHSSLEQILKPTYGVMVYQEQVMEIARVLSGYTLGEADILRRAMGKKSESEMMAQRSKFIDGASLNNVDKKISTEIFDGIEKFAMYAFNKSHSAAYALIAYQTAWLKTHYPSQFMAAVMSADMDHTEKVVTMLEESHKLGLEVLPPDINLSNYKFVASSDTQIIYGLGAIKGVGEAAIELILEERQQGMFADLHDFCKRVDSFKVNKRVIEAMIRAGAMDSIVPLADNNKSWQGRATLLASMSTAIRFAEQENKNQASGQDDMFQLDDAELDKRFSYIKAPVWSDDERLYGERNILGLFLTGHPINQYKNDLDNFISTKISDIDKSSRNVRFAGLLIEIRIRNTKQGKKIAILKLDDRSGQIEVALFTKAYEEYQHLLAMDTILVIEGNVRDDDFTGGFRVMVDRIMDFNTARAEYVKYMQISYKESDLDIVGELQGILKPFVGDKCPIKISYSNQDGASNIWLGEQWRVLPATELLARLNDLSWVDDVSLYYN